VTTIAIYHGVVLGRRRGSQLAYVVASVLGLTVIGVAIAGALSSGGKSAAATGSNARSTAHAGAMAGMMNMPGMDSPPPAPKNLSATSPCTVKACPIPKADGGTLAVAARLGSATVAAWIRPTATGRGGDASKAGGTLRARVELVDTNLTPVVEPITFTGQRSRAACGPGCWILTVPERQRALTVGARQHGREYTASLPLQWNEGAGARARALVQRATIIMRSLPGVRLEESTGTGVPAADNHVHFLLRAPDAMSATVTGHADRQVTIGATQWSYSPGVGWLRGSYDGGQTGPFTIDSLFNWIDSTQSAQIVRESRGAEPTAVVALMNPKVPDWIRLTLDTRTWRVERVQMVSQGTFTTDRFSDFGVVPQITPPKMH
jgi:hypothetical protein